MCVELLFEWVSWVPEIVGVVATISCFLAPYSTKEVNSPFNVHILPKFCISDNHFTHALTIIFVGTPELFAAIRSLSRMINILVWPV